MNYEETKEAAGSIEYVDLGLSVKWANCNLGAQAPEETGYRFSFEEKAKVDFVTLPTKEQCEELINNCTWKWRAGKNKGAIVTGKNGNSIFLPAVGEMDYSGKMYAEGKGGSYWSSSFQGTDGKYGYYLSFIYGLYYINRKWKYELRPSVQFTQGDLRSLIIRPVQP